MRSSLPIFLLAMVALLSMASSFALEGEWVLSNHPDLQLDPSISVEFEFKKEIRAKQVARQMILKACYELSYSYELSGNDIVITYNNVINIPRKCQKGEISTLRSKIDTIFYFTIDGSTLKLYNPTGFAPFVLQRKVKQSPKALNGRW